MDGEGDCQGDAVEEPGEFAAHAPKACVNLDQTQHLAQAVQTDAHAVGDQEITPGLYGPGSMDNQDQDGGTQEKSRIIAEGEPGQHQQRDMHEQGREVEAFHGISSFRGYYTSDGMK